MGSKYHLANYFSPHFFFSLSFQALPSFRDSGSPSLHSLFKTAVSGGPVDFFSMKTPHDNCPSLIPSCPAPGDHSHGGPCEHHPLELNDYNVGQCGSTRTHHAEAWCKVTFLDPKFCRAVSLQGNPIPF